MMSVDQIKHILNTLHPSLVKISLNMKRVYGL